MRDWFPWFLYEVGYWGSLTGLTLLNSFRSEGKHNIPRTGPALLISNHQSFLDPSIVGCGTRRHLSFLARKTLFRNRFFGGLITRLNAVPVDQEGIAKEGLKAILDHLNAGQAVLVFPEGERTYNGQIQPLRPGILMLLKRTDAPVVPVGMAGAFDAWPRTRKWPRLSPLFLPPTGADIAVSVGAPIPAAHFRQMPRAQVLTELAAELERLHQRAERLRRPKWQPKDPGQAKA